MFQFVSNNKRANYPSLVSVVAVGGGGWRGGAVGRVQAEVEHVLLVEGGVGGDVELHLVQELVGVERVGEGALGGRAHRVHVEGAGRGQWLVRVAGQVVDAEGAVLARPVRGTRGQIVKS